MIKIDNFSFSYKKRIVIDNVNLHIEKGSFSLFYGLNGSGKTTMIKIILGFLNANIIRNYNQVAYMPEKTVLPDYLTIEEFLNDLSYLCKSFDYNPYLEMFNLDKKQMIYTLSKGNKQKISLIQLLMTDADLYILDEPTNGLDHESTNKLIKALRKKRNKTIIIVTHYQKLFSRFKIKRYEFNNGKIQEIT